jgi:pteridine reductase
LRASSPAHSGECHRPEVVLLPGWDEGSALRLASTTPLRRNGSPEDVMRAFEYVLDAPFVTGQVLMVDGGRSIRR